MPSLVSWVVLPPATSRVHRFSSRMNTAFLPSGESDSLRPPPPPRPPRPPLPPRPPRPVPASAGPSASHFAPPTSQLQCLPERLKATVAPSAEGSISVNGRCPASYFVPAAVDSDAASLAWSKAGWRVPLAGSTSTNSLPSAVVTRYQKRSPDSQLGRTPLR